MFSKVLNMEAFLVFCITLSTFTTGYLDPVVMEPKRGDEMCPNVTTRVPDFNITRFFGNWYISEAMSHGYNNLPPQCARFNIIQTDYGTLLAYTVREYFNVGRGFTDGAISQLDASRPAEMYFIYPDPHLFAPIDNYNITVVETDYENYAVLFSCKLREMFNINWHIHFTWIMTRERGVAPSNLQAIKARLAGQGVDTQRLSLIDNGRNNPCPPHFFYP